MKKLALITLLILLTSCTSTTVCFETFCENMELADTEEERNYGLTGREYLETGMLFIARCTYTFRDHLDR